MSCLVFHLFPLLFCWWKIRCLSFDYHREWRGVVKFDICAVLSESWLIRDEWKHDLGSSRVQISTQSSEVREPVLLAIFESLLKRGGFIVIASTGAEVFSIPNFFPRARET
ncbi:hypothetical protein [Gimesia aquarii]|uniref:Uncharacterized protein n=1 Tax=Gimesia aquarii TaxID=2527964 RepID=A0A517X0J7_9PLAN|nr:hypothetical protein [Gimesia aquarii]QDU11035.1 hypothetical protein V202x_44510 [Gimesia aquarii]